MVDKSEKFSWLVRVGYFSRAILYFVLGTIRQTASKLLTVTATFKGCVAAAARSRSN